MHFHVADKHFLTISHFLNRLRQRASSAVSEKKRKEDLTAKHVYQVAKKNRFPTWHQWRQLPSFLSKSETRLGTTALTLICLSLVLGLSTFYFGNRIPIPAAGGEYTEGLVGEPQFVNPILSPGSTVDADLTRLVFRGLFLFDPIEGTMVPDLARSVETNEDGTIYTVRLREDATWHDGKPVTSRDAAFTFSAIANPEYKSPLALSFRGVTIETPDAFTIVFTLPESFNSFLSSLDTGLLPAHLWEGIVPKRANLASLNLQPVGNGPYKFEKFSKDQNGVIRSYTLTRSKNFYGTRPRIETLTFKFYPDAAGASDALQNRNVEGLAFLSQEEARALEDNRSVRLLRPSLPQATILFFNETREGAFKDKRLREALGFALNRKAIVEKVFDGHAKPMGGALLPGTLAEETPVPEADLAKAIELLDATPWKRDPLTGRRQKEASSEDTQPEALRIEITTVEAPDMLLIAQEVRAAWEPLGIEVEIRSVPQSRFHTDVIAGRTYDVLLSGILFGAEGDPFPFWHSSQVNDPGVNLAQYSNRKVDEALEAARGSVEGEKRRAALSMFEKLILEDAPAVFLLQPAYTYVTSAKIQGMILNHIIDPSDRFNRVEEWYVKTKKAFRLRGN